MLSLWVAMSWIPLGLEGKRYAATAFYRCLMTRNDKSDVGLFDSKSLVFRHDSRQARATSK